MVISTRTYHIVANVAPPEAGGPLQLGTIVDSLEDLTPLNEGEELEVLYKHTKRSWHERLNCIHEENFEATRDQIAKGSGGVGAKVMAWQIPVGADISGEGETSADDTFNAKSLDTLFFYPTKADYAEAVKSTQLQDYLHEAKYPPVYFITGIKIAREPSVNLKRGNKTGVQGQLGFNMGDGSNIGGRGEGSKARNTTQKSERSSDTVLAIRVRKLSYKMKYYIAGQRQLSDTAHDRGAELVSRNRSEGGSSNQEAEFDVDELELNNEELQGSIKQDEGEDDGETVT